MRNSFLIFCIAIFSRASADVHSKKFERSDKSFDEVITELYQKKPHLLELVKEKQLNKQQVQYGKYFVHFLSSEELQHSINIAALLYATLLIYTRYNSTITETNGRLSRYLMFLTKTGPTMIMSNMGKILLPRSTYNLISSLPDQGNFLIDCTGIFIEVVVLKMCIKLIIACGTNDLTDLMEHGAIRLKKLIKNIIVA